MQRVDRIYDEACARLAAGLAAYALGLPLSDILQAKRGSAQIALARQIAMYAVYVVLVLVWRGLLLRLTGIAQRCPMRVT